MQALAAENAALQTEVRTYASAVLASDVTMRMAASIAKHSDEAAPWVAAALRLVSGSVQVAQSAGQVQRLAADQEAGGQPIEAPGRR